jgi:hypothetical protein
MLPAGRSDAQMFHISDMLQFLAATKQKSSIRVFSTQRRVTAIRITDVLEGSSHATRAAAVKAPASFATNTISVDLREV